MVELPLAFMAIAAVVIPFINAGVQRVNWSPKTKTLIALAVSFLVSIAILWATGGLSAATLLTSVPTIFAYQHLVYQFILKNVATKFEAITTPGSIIVANSPIPGLAEVTTDKTIKATGDNVTVPAPVAIDPTPVPQIVKDENVAG
jgi:hypothetical protein